MSSVKTTFLRAATADHLLLQGLLHQPEQHPWEGAVLHVHGMGGNFYENRFLDTMAKAYTDAGLALLTVNTRGHDAMADVPLVAGDSASIRRGVAYETFAECVHDIAAWLDLLSSRTEAPVFVQGHSLGASKAVYYLQQTGDERVQGLVLLSATEMLQYAEAQSGHADRVTEAAALLKEGRGGELLPGLVWDDGYVMSASTYVDFTTRGNPIDVFSGYAPGQPAPLGQVRTPLLAVMGTNDEGIVAIGTTAHAYLDLLRAKATACASFETYIPECNHGYRGAENQVATTVSTWLRQLS